MQVGMETGKVPPHPIAILPTYEDEVFAFGISPI